MEKVRDWLAVALATSIILGITLFAAKPVKAHSWYPNDCCHDKDCFPADTVIYDKDGNMTITFQYGPVFVDKSFTKRPSQDENYHVCVRKGNPNENRTWMPRCVFVPAGA